MRFGSVCSGIEAASAAWHPLGWETAWVAEVEKFPSAVLAHHYPTTPNLGDVTSNDFIHRARALGSIDLLVGGFPCQDLSVAGTRKGLNHEDGRPTRSGLFYAIADLCDTLGQRWTVLENVPGLLSSKGGRDFASVVGTLSGADLDVPKGGWQNAGFALGPKGLVEWSILDAQFFGVPQRRRRVFIVRDSGDWASRPPLLLEPHSLQGHPAPRRETGQETTGSLSSRATAGGGLGTDFDCAGGLQPVTHTVAFTQNQAGDVLTGPVAPSMGTNQNASGRNTPKVMTYVAGFSAGQTKGAGSIAYQEEQSPTRHAVQTGQSVRRLMPEECEKLQGFSVGFTRIPWRNKAPEDCPDGPRYRALGNSMAVPCMQWIGQRIEKVEAL